MRKHDFDLVQKELSQEEWEKRQAERAALGPCDGLPVHELYNKLLKHRIRPNREQIADLMTPWNIIAIMAALKSHHVLFRGDEPWLGRSADDSSEALQVTNH